MTLNALLQKYSFSFFIGFLLFLSSTIFSFTRNLRLQKKIAEVENQETINRVKIRHLETLLALQRKYLGKKIIEFETTDSTSRIFSSDTLKKYQYSLIIFILGGCSLCFEEEAYIWDQLIYDMKRQGLFGFGVNISFDNDLILHYLKNGKINYPVLHHHEIFSTFLNGFSAS